MDCLHFYKWLENRDTFDVSEADKALKHASLCEECAAKLAFDEALDRQLFEVMREVEMPPGLASKIDLDLDKASAPSARNRWGIYGAFSAVMAAMVVFAVSFTLSPVPAIPTMDALGKYVIADHHHHDDSILVVEDPDKIGTLSDIDLPYERIREELPANYHFVGARVCPLGECDSVHLVFLDEGRRISVFLVKSKDVGFSLSPGKQYTVSSAQESVSFWKEGKYVLAKVG